MDQQIRWVTNSVQKTSDSYLPYLSQAFAQKARSFHQSMQRYTMTPLVKLTTMASFLNIDNLFVKDESYRFGLNSFKVLGSSYAIASYLASLLHKDVSELSYDVLIRDELKKTFDDPVFFTASQGNHGRGVAFFSRLLHQKAVVFLPKESSHQAIYNIRKEGAIATICDANYDECVKLAKAEAKKRKHGVMIQDTAWDGYEEIPLKIMQGYMTMADEAVTQLFLMNEQLPTHIFLQAGTGSMAGAICGYFMNIMTEHPPKIIVCETRATDCLYQSACNLDGTLVSIKEVHKTIMTELSRREANPIAWDILRNHCTAFLSLTDACIAKGMRMLAAPLKPDAVITTGESGAAGFAALTQLCTQKEYQEVRNAIGLTKDSRVLVFSTEGDTDLQRYQSIVWDGKNT